MRMVRVAGDGSCKDDEGSSGVSGSRYCQARTSYPRCFKQCETPARKAGLGSSGCSTATRVTCPSSRERVPVVSKGASGQSVGSVPTSSGPSADSDRVFHQKVAAWLLFESWACVHL